jgi:hypothetical protein
MGRKKLDLIWQKFWRLECVWFSHINNHNNHKASYRIFVCECWKELIRWWSRIKNWHVKSCWCLTIEILKKWVHRSHMMTWSKIYNVRWHMKSRCYDKHMHAYKRYWWRWIKVCDKRLRFEWFMEDMYESYLEHLKLHWPRQTSLDRINNNWNYEKSNCRWATMKEQANNRNNTILSLKQQPWQPTTQ